MHQIAPFQNRFCKTFLGRGSPGLLPKPLPALVSGLALDSGLALNSRALRALDSGFALSFHAVQGGRARFIYYRQKFRQAVFIPSYATVTQWANLIVILKKSAQCWQTPLFLTNTRKSPPNVGNRSTPLLAELHHLGFRQLLLSVSVLFWVFIISVIKCAQQEFSAQTFSVRPAANARSQFVFGPRFTDGYIWRVL